MLSSAKYFKARSLWTGCGDANMVTWESLVASQGRQHIHCNLSLTADCSLAPEHVRTHTLKLKVLPVCQVAGHRVCARTGIDCFSFVDVSSEKQTRRYEPCFNTCEVQTSTNSTHTHRLQTDNFLLPRLDGHDQHLLAERSLKVRSYIVSVLLQTRA